MPPLSFPQRAAPDYSCCHLKFPSPSSLQGLCFNFQCNQSQSKLARGFLACWCLESSFSWDTCLTPADCPINHPSQRVESAPGCQLSFTQASWVNLSPSCSNIRFHSPQLQQQLMLVLRHRPYGFSTLPPCCPCHSEASWLICSQFPQLSIISTTEPQLW